MQFLYNMSFFFFFFFTVPSMIISPRSLILDIFSPYNES